MRRGLALIRLFLLSASVLQAQAPPQLETATFVVLGEGLAAGLADFSLREVYQRNNFPALIARQIGAAFPQPYIQAPGIGSVPGFPELPVAVPGPFQTSVRTPFPPPLFVFNLAVPGHRLTDAINLRPSPPLIHQNNSKQTTTNLLLGYPAMILDRTFPLWTQLDYAVAMNPTLVLVELGYTEALEAAVQGDANLMPEPAAFRADYARVLSAVRSNFAQVITTTIPDPLDTAYVSTPSAAAEVTRIPASTLISRYGFRDGDLLAPTVLFKAAVGAPALPAGVVLNATQATAIRNRVRALNTEIVAASQQAGAIVYDLNALFARIRASGLTVGNQRLTANYLGGFYSLSGSYPGLTGHALIANEILTLINQTFRTSFALVDLAQTVRNDPAVRFRPITPAAESPLEPESPSEPEGHLTRMPEPEGVSE